MFHGTKANVEQMIDKDGNLILNPSKNFEGRTNSVSFTEYEDVAKDYASRNKGSKT